MVDLLPRSFIPTGDFHTQPHNTPVLQETVGNDLIETPMYALADETLARIGEMFTNFSTGTAQAQGNALLTALVAGQASLLLAAQALAPASSHYAITPDDDADLASSNLRALFVGTGGNIKVRVNGQDVTYVVADSTTLPVRAQMVYATGTDADDIVGWA